MYAPALLSLLPQASSWCGLRDIWWTVQAASMSRHGSSWRVLPHEREGTKEWIAPTGAAGYRPWRKRSYWKAVDNQGRDVERQAWSKCLESKNNGIDPQEMVDKLRRWYSTSVHDVCITCRHDAGMASLALKAQTASLNVFETGSRSLCWGAAESVDASALSGDESTSSWYHKTIMKVTDDIGRRQTFNTAISLRYWNWWTS